MIVLRSHSVENAIWKLRALLPNIESTPMILAKRQVEDYSIALGTLGYLYVAISELLETLVEIGTMAQNIGLDEYSAVIGPDRAYITSAQLPEVMPYLPSPKPVPPLPKRDVEINTFGCGDLAPDLVRFCINGVEIGYYVIR